MDFSSLDWQTQAAVYLAGTFVVILAWTFFTISALHRRDVFFWGLASTWMSLVTVPIVILVAWIGAAGEEYSTGPVAVAGLLYALSLLFSLFYNWHETRSLILALSTTLLQQLATLMIIYLICRFTIFQTKSEPIT